MRAQGLIVLAFAIAMPANANVVRGPYLQGVGSTSATVVLDLEPCEQLDGCPTPTVRLALDDGSKLLATSTADGSHHEIVIEGLSPGTTYPYGILLGDAVALDGLELTTAVEPGEPFSFAVLGDTRSDHTSHGTVVEAIQSENVDFLLNTGDLVSSGGERDQWDTFLAIEQPLMQRIPLYPVVGNHEEYSGDAPEFREVFVLPGNELYYSFDVGNAHFTVLDHHARTVAACEQDGELVVECFDEEQTAWLEEDLRGAAADPTLDHIFVAVHMGPFTSKAGRTGSAQMRYLLPLLDEVGVTAILSGHDHYYERGESPEGIPYLISGGGGAPLYDISDPCDNPHTVFFNDSVLHYVVVDVDGLDVSFTTRTATGAILDTLQVEASPWEEPTDDDDPADDDDAPPPGSGIPLTEAPEGCICTSSPARSSDSRLALCTALALLAITRRRYRSVQL